MTGHTYRLLELLAEFTKSNPKYVYCTPNVAEELMMFSGGATIWGVEIRPLDPMPENAKEDMFIA